MYILNVDSLFFSGQAMPVTAVPNKALTTEDLGDIVAALYQTRNKWWFIGLELKV